jgi:hypothetical protein
MVVLLFVAVCSFVEAAPSSRYGVVVDNKVLATVRGQVVTVIDVMKKLDMIFYQQFPQYRGSSEARFEFYQTNWRKILQELVDRHLILVLAEERGFQVTNGDIRQELEEIFGPNVMMNLYEAGLSLHEVYDMMKADILLRRILSFYVRMPVFASITPEVLKLAYGERGKDAKRQESWLWRSVTLRAKEGNCAKEVADTVWKLLEQDHLSMEVVQSKLPEGVEIIVSSPFHSDKRELAPHLQTLFESLSVASYSAPVSFTNRSDPRHSWRFYVIDEKKEGVMLSFSEMEQNLREELAGPEIDKRTKDFFDDLRKQYHVKQSLGSEDLLAFEPFHLKPRA